MIESEHKILNRLREIENENDIEIIYACEVGSRAWGFSSPTSGHNIRFIYIKNVKSYLSLNDMEDDVITIPTVDGVDICGFDLRKFCSLILKSNPTPFEWMNSSIRYIETADSSALHNLLPRYFDSVRAYAAHRGMGSKTYSAISALNAEPNVKKLLYVIRSVLSMVWIREMHSMPPVSINQLASVLKDEQLKNSILKLIDVKIKHLAFKWVDVPDMVINFIVKGLDTDITPYKQKEDKTDPEALNQYIFNTVTASMCDY